MKKKYESIVDYDFVIRIKPLWQEILEVFLTMCAGIFIGYGLSLQIKLLMSCCGC